VQPSPRSGNIASLIFIFIILYWFILVSVDI
jgi:hypothetical protein